MSYEKRKGWLANLKVGDKVAVSSSRGDDDTVETLVERSTRKGARTKVFGVSVGGDVARVSWYGDDGSVFSGGTWGTTTSINPLSDHVLAVIKHRKNKRHALNYLTKIEEWLRKSTVSDDARVASVRIALQRVWEEE